MAGKHSSVALRNTLLPELESERDQTVPRATLPSISGPPTLAVLTMPSLSRRAKRQGLENSAKALGIFAHITRGRHRRQICLCGPGGLIILDDQLRRAIEAIDQATRLHPVTARKARERPILPLSHLL